MKNTPDFIGIGMQKAGTTWLAANLGRHPSVWTPPIKEIHYFDEVHVNPDWYQRRQGASLNNLKWLRAHNSNLPPKVISKEIAFWQHMRKRHINDIWYQSIWSSFHDSDKKAIGEITPDYSILPLEGVQHVYKLAPDAKIIILLRDPIDRNWSSVRMYAKEQHINPLECYKAQFIIDRSRIIQMLNTWEKTYSEDKFFIAFYEDIRTKPYWLLRSICNFLKIDFKREYFPHAREKVHVGKGMEMPNNILEYYKKEFYDDISFARDRFQGYAETWYNAYY